MFLDGSFLVPKPARLLHRPAATSSRVIFLRVVLSRGPEQPRSVDLQICCCHGSHSRRRGRSFCSGHLVGVLREGGQLVGGRGGEDRGQGRGRVEGEEEEVKRSEFKVGKPWQGACRAEFRDLRRATRGSR